MSALTVAGAMLAAGDVAEVQAQHGSLPVPDMSMASAEGPPAAPSPSAPLAMQDRWVAADKWRHFFASYALTAFTYATGVGVGLSHDGSLGAGVAGAILAGVIKEAVDARAGHGPSTRDMIWNVIGVGAAVLMLQSTR